MAPAYQGRQVWTERTLTGVELFWNVANPPRAIGAVSRRTCWQERESGEGGEVADRSVRTHTSLSLATNGSSAQRIGEIESLTGGKILLGAGPGSQRGPRLQELSKVGSGTPLARS